VNYAGESGLWFLAARNRESGAYLHKDCDRKLAEEIGFRLPEDVVWGHGELAGLPMGTNMEGWVATYPSGLRVKVKSPDYVRVHRLLKHITPRRVLDLIQEGTLDDVRAQLPDGLRFDLDCIAGGLMCSINALIHSATSHLHQVYAERSDELNDLAPDPRARKILAEGLKQLCSTEELPIAFGIHDGRAPDKIMEMACKAVRRTLREEREADEQASTTARS
jgi:hypothetical protein